MTEQDRALAEQWMAHYQDYYAKLPDTFARRLGPEIEELDTAARTILVRFCLDDWALNPMGTVHGGIIASMADTTAGMLNKALMGVWEGGPTVSLSMHYLRPVLANSEVLVRASCQKKGAFLGYTTCEAFYRDKPEEILFTGEAVFFSALPPENRFSVAQAGG